MSVRLPRDSAATELHTQRKGFGAPLVPMQLPARRKARHQAVRTQASG